VLALLAQLASVEGESTPLASTNEGILRGALVELKSRKLKSHQFTAG
jgi:hypothetical protein